MDALAIPWREVLLVGIGVLLVYIVEMFLPIRSGARSGRMFGNDDRAKQRRELDLLWEKLDQLVGDVDALKADFATLKTMAEKGPMAAYANAIQLARQGEDAGAIAMACAISRGEAELIVDLQKAGS